MEVKPYTPIGGAESKPPETGGLIENEAYCKALDEAEAAQDTHDRIDSMLGASRKERLKSCPQKKQAAWNMEAPPYNKTIKIANYAFLGAGIIASFMAPNLIVSIAASVATMVCMAKGVPRKVIEKCFIEGKVNKRVKIALEKEKSEAREKLEAARVKLKEAEAVAKEEQAGRIRKHEAVVEDDDEHITIGGLRLDKNN